MVYPLIYSNVLFFVNVTLGFWLVGLAQRSFWLIDPYWTLIPPLLGDTTCRCCRASSHPLRINALPQSPEHQWYSRTPSHRHQFQSSRWSSRADFELS